MSPEVIRGYKNWELCPRTERLTLESIGDGAVMLVNGMFGVKFHGKIAGLALEDRENIERGRWYTLKESDQERLQQAFMNKQTDVELSDLVWIELRLSRDTFDVVNDEGMITWNNDEFCSFVTQKMRNLQPLGSEIVHGRDNGLGERRPMSRRDYLTAYAESFNPPNS